MKRAPAQLAALQGLLDRDITVALVAEELFTIEAGELADDVRSELEYHGFDECGVARDGYVCQYVRREALGTGRAGDHARPVPLERVVAPSTPLWACMGRLAANGPLYVLGERGLDGIVTKNDLSKQPARLLMFGVVSLLEMTMLALVRREAGETWRDCLTEQRLLKAKRLHDERRKQRGDIDVADCLELADKVTIFVKTDSLEKLLGPSRNNIETQFNALQEIRNNLAHAQSPAADGDWAGVIETLERGHAMLNACVAELARA